MFSVIPVTANAEEFIPRGKCGKNAYYTVDSDGKVVISGTGDMYKEPIFCYEGAKKVEIKEGITGLGYVFYGCSYLTEITISNTVKSISEQAFGNCTGLTEITIPNTVTSIGYDAFVGCTGLTNITISDSVTTIADEAFEDCFELTDVYYTGTKEQ